MINYFNNKIKINLTLINSFNQKILKMILILTNNLNNTYIKINIISLINIF